MLYTSDFKRSIFPAEKQNRLNQPKVVCWSANHMFSQLNQLKCSQNPSKTIKDQLAIIKILVPLIKYHQAISNACWKTCLNQPKMVSWTLAHLPAWIRPRERICEW